MRLLYQLSALLLFLSSLVLAQDCQIVVPPRPLTAAGLATPYILQAAPGTNNVCDAANKAVSSAFVHAVIIDKTTGQVSVYNPLVISANTMPAIQPTVPNLPANAVVGIWFGFNGNTLTLVNTAGTTSLTDGMCVPGLNVNGQVDVFVQFAYCNAPAFFAAANNAILNGKLVIPPLGNAVDGQLCPNVRAWEAVDQDQSDNVPTTYLVDIAGTIAQGMLAQNTAANRALLGPAAMVLGNPSDNALVTNFIMPAVGCGNSVWKVPDLADPGSMVTALPLNELQAAKFASIPQALIPLNHAFTKLIATGAQSPAKTNLYRVGANQPKISETANAGAGAAGQANPTKYCQMLNQQGGPRLAKFKPQMINFMSPDNMHANLYTFLTDRFATSNNADNLNCPALGVTPFTAF